jgi:hypothetical protein
MDHTFLSLAPQPHSGQIFAPLIKRTTFPLIKHSGQMLVLFPHIGQTTLRLKSLIQVIVPQEAHFTAWSGQKSLRQWSQRNLAFA